jgi:hypothetical protein
MIHTGEWRMVHTGGLNTDGLQRLMGTKRWGTVGGQVNGDDLLEGSSMWTFHINFSYL